MRVRLVRIEIGFFRPDVRVVFTAARRRGFRAVNRSAARELFAEIHFYLFFRKSGVILHIPVQTVAYGAVAHGKKIVRSASRGNGVYRSGNGGIPCRESLIIIFEEIEKRRRRFGAMCNRMLDAPKTIPAYSIGENGESTAQEMENPKYLDGTKREIVQFFYDVNPGGQAIQCSTMQVVNLTRLPIYSLVIVILTTGAGVWIFKKKDLK